MLLHKFRSINNIVNKLEAFILILQFILVVTFFSMSPFFSDYFFSLNFIEFSLILIIVIPLHLVASSLKRKIKMLNDFDKSSNNKKKSEFKSKRIFTENERTFKSFEDFERARNSSSQQKNEFNIRKEKPIIYYSELKIMNLPEKELKFFKKQEIKEAFRAQAKIWHPDKAKNEYEVKIRNEKMAEINEAYNKLLNLLEKN